MRLPPPDHFCSYGLIFLQSSEHCVFTVRGQRSKELNSSGLSLRPGNYDRRKLDRRLPESPILPQNSIPWPGARSRSPRRASSFPCSAVAHRACSPTRSRLRALSLSAPPAAHTHSSRPPSLRTPSGRSPVPGGIALRMLGSSTSLNRSYRYALRMCALHSIFLPPASSLNLAAGTHCACSNVWGLEFCLQWFILRMLTQTPFRPHEHVVRMLSHHRGSQPFSPA